MKTQDVPVLRPLAEADAPQAAAFIRACFSQLAATVDPPPSALRETAENVAAIVARGGGAAIEDACGLAGLVLWAEQDDGLSMSRLSVRGDCRGRGLGRALVAAAEAEARRRGLRRLHLATRLALTGNRRLFAACGFVETRRQAHPGYDEPTFVDMELRLA